MIGYLDTPVLPKMVSIKHRAFISEICTSDYSFLALQVLHSLKHDSVFKIMYLENLDMEIAYDRKHPGSLIRD